jgi:hypothetical protein
VIPDTVSFYNQPKKFPIFLLDDADALNCVNWKVRVRAFNASLELIKEVSIEGVGEGNAVHKAGNIEFSPEEAESSPLFIYSEVYTGDEKRFETFYILNYEYTPGAIFTLP